MGAELVADITSNQLHWCTCIFSYAVDPLIVNDSHLSDTPSHILVSVNSLCQDDEYTITVIFGTQPTDIAMDCDYQIPNVTVKVAKLSNEIAVNVPADILPGDGEEYCYRAVLSDVQGRAIDGIHTYYSIADYQNQYYSLFDR